MAHTPDSQISPPAHATPQAPQLAGSTSVAIQTSSQEVWPGGQGVASPAPVSTGPESPGPASRRARPLLVAQAARRTQAKDKQLYLIVRLHHDLGGGRYSRRLLARSTIALLSVSIFACGGSREPLPIASPDRRVDVDPEPIEHIEDGGVGDAGIDAPSPAVVAIVDGATPADSAAAPTLNEPEPEATGLAAMQPLIVSAPPMVRSLARAPSPVLGARLRRISARANRVTDVEAWFTANQLTDPATRAQGFGRNRRVQSPHYALVVMGQHLGRIVETPDVAILFYGRSGQGGAGPYLAVVSRNGDVRAFFDFSRWTGGYGVHGMIPEFAWVVGDILYVSHMHRTYAATTQGQNAYLSAIDMSTGALVWRSAPLEANTRTFAVVGDVIVTGYGFTDEKDDLYVLDRHTGRRLTRARLESGPRFIIERGGTIYVRSYNRDYEYALTVRTR